jgi:membrane protease subunit HflK
MLVFLFKRLGARLAGVKLSLNDPRWGHGPGDERKSQEGRRPNGNKNDDGPPDLDQLWRDFNGRLNRLLGKKEGGSGGGGSFRPDARGFGVGAAVVAAIAALIWLASGAFIIQEGQVGIVTTFGEYSHRTGAGFNWRWPAPFQAHQAVNTASIEHAEIGYRANLRNKQPNEALMLTADENLVDVQFSVQYRVKDPVAWLFNNRNQVETLRGAAETTVRRIVGANKMDAVLYESRARLVQDAQRQIQQMTDQYVLGAEIVGVTLQSVQPPDQVAAAFEEGVKAQEDRARQRADAQAYADDVIPQAKGRAARLLTDAEAYRATVVGTAEGNAARFDQVVAEYAKAPAVTRDRMYIETMQNILSTTSKVMIDAKTGTNSIYLPLDRLLAQSTANEADRGSRSGPIMAQPQPQAPAQQNPAQPQPQQPPQQQPQQQPQPQTQLQPESQPVQPVPGQESQRTRDLRSRDTGRERESR